MLYLYFLDLELCSLEQIVPRKCQYLCFQNKTFKKALNEANRNILNIHGKVTYLTTRLLN